ncbi:hypothetical protein CMQ_4514 [Grosmannia clavigera kw1407]|uniref:Uncharacterized protein n=1 Tax=Grosmannia clavigera (strain kw1407 / UAMH 11150) TaxID=655863 RepID=F0XU81_GROCL|nr:uncharacterized protein CMQ_4514 [Grosmannia clavigera kw1407]EFW98662.1 hypothetical protein CMQ_4514 [Grosmannia clavigera kw1407]
MASSARFKKTYFLAPNFDYPPGGSLALGSILTNPFDPSTCINAGGGLPFPSDMPVQTSLKLDWRDERSQRRGGAIGLWAQFLNLLGIEAEVGVKCAVDNSSVYQFDKLETQFIEPTKEYIEQSVLDVPSVVSHIIESGYRKPVYMITGNTRLPVEQPWRPKCRWLWVATSNSVLMGYQAGYQSVPAPRQVSGKTKPAR